MNNMVTALVLVIAGVLLGVVTCRYMSLKKKKESVTSTLIVSRLRECSDLTTCILEYQDLVKFEQGSIPLITKKSFSMIYKANIRAGVDLSKASVEVTRNIVTITIPETEVQSIEVDTNSLRFYDERLALFNWNHKEDIASAIDAARTSAETHANFDQLKSQARKQAEIVIRQLVGPAVDGSRELVIR